MRKRPLALLARCGLIALLAAPLPALCAGQEAGGGAPDTATDGERRLPAHRITQPGFPGALAGKCASMQDCAAYCKKHGAADGCKKQRKAPH
jgi:hypothetical protein